LKSHIHYGNQLIKNCKVNFLIFEKDIFDKIIHIVITNYFTRETERRAFVKHRWNLREEEKREKERLAAMKAGIAPSHIPTQEEIDIRMKNEYNDFIQFEFGVLREMGLRDENEAPVIIPAAS
jgi:hypothetical protein